MPWRHWGGRWAERPLAGRKPCRRRVERRLSAILAADVVGYSGLMERDEAGTFEHLMRLRRELVEPLLARHGGRFVDLKGDGAIVEFGIAQGAVSPCTVVDAEAAGF